MERALRHYMTCQPHVVRSDTTAAAAHRLMRSFGIRHLPVADDHGPIGIVTERDLQMLESMSDVGTRSLHVSDAMTRNPFVVSPEIDVDDVAGRMAGHHFGSAIVVENGKVVGIFTAVDALRVVVALGTRVWSPPTCDRWGSIIEPTAPFRRT